VQDLLLEGKIEMGHARALLPLGGAAQVQLAQRVAQQRLSVRQVEQLVQRALHPPVKAQKSPDRDLIRLEEELAEILGATVAIQSGKGGRGKVVVEFASLDQLDGLIERMRG
jgi:ParB family chromosome partitioning protein